MKSLTHQLELWLQEHAAMSDSAEATIKSTETKLSRGDGLYGLASINAFTSEMDALPS